MHSLMILHNGQILMEMATETIKQAPTQMLIQMTAHNGPIEMVTDTETIFPE